MFPEQLNTNTLLVHLTSQQLLELMSKTFAVELEKVLPYVLSAVKSSINEQKLYTRKEAAEKLNVSLTTLHNWKVQGILVPMQSGRKCLYTAEQLDTFLNGRTDELPY
ncbi:helix-turn-helix domain-containing protein [Pontibacter sp. BT310]|nr:MULTISPECIES: helix-turn-helix domain-containing protein [Pontibacter]MBJ6119498.1 helix-turn-helix domain-containing protein [Pontibacter sp. BT310]